ncbi:MAG TPA: hypothetical protein VF314_01100 [Actinomycetes bacterium]
MPVDQRSLDLDDGDAPQPVVRHRLDEREADTETADQQGARGRVRLERGAHEQPLGATVTGVHEEGAVADQLVVAAGTAQDQLAARSRHPLDDRRLVHGSRP